MEILIVEDSDAKAAAIDLILRNTVGKNVTIERASSFVAAVRKLEVSTFDLLVLDLMLPIRDGEIAVSDGGKRVLSEIVCGSGCRRPSHIICLTAFEDISNLLKEEEEKNLVHVVIYKETDGRWQQALAAKAEYVNRRLAEAESFPREYETDIAILTSSPHVELREVIKIPGEFIGEYNRSDALYYYKGSWNRIDRRILSVVACAAPMMGMTAACATALKVIERWRPRFLVMTGIAAATKSDQKFGDVLVAESAYDYGSGKILALEDGTRKFIPSPNQLHIDAELFAILQRWEREQLQMDAIRLAWYEQIRSTPKLAIGVFATGAAVVQSQALVDEILGHSRKVVGLEMEAYAVFHAAHLARSPKPKVLIAKSVSDFADGNKNDQWQQFAAFTSARFIYQFFTNCTEVVD